MDIQLSAPRAFREETPFSVSQLNREARFLLEGHFPSVLVEGELSNVAMPGSGHWYMSLKDERAQLRCAMFRNRNLFVRFRPKDGMQVLVKGRLSLYEGRGDYQLIVEHMEERGDGALRRAFEVLQAKLQREGLFDEARKRPLPVLPRHIGVITSPTGAAIRDILSVLQRRCPMIRVTILPVPVQGQEAAPAMLRALQLANERQGCLQDLDVLLLARGGGSLEDLWSFNDESLARAIHASALPVVSAVGHEIDFSIADFVADRRAPTPSAAAEILSPDQRDYLLTLAATRKRLAGCIAKKLRQEEQRLGWLSKGLRHPGRRLQEQAQRLDDLEGRLRQYLRHRLFRAGAALEQLRGQVFGHNPGRQIEQRARDISQLRRRLDRAMRQSLHDRGQRLAARGQALHAVSPLSTLARGYSITRDAEGQVLRQAAQVRPGDHLVTRVAAGEIHSTVTSSKSDSP